MAKLADISGRMSAEIVACLGGAEFAVRQYGVPSCSGRTVSGPAGNTYLLLMVVLICMAMALGAIGVKNGSKLGFVGLASALILLMPV